MNEFRARAIAEGDCLPRDDDEYLEAWRVMVDSRLAFQLKGKILEKAQEMIKNGILAPGNYRGLFDEGVKE